MNIKRAFNETGKKKIMKYVKMIVLIVGSPVLACVLTMTGLFFDYESSKPLFSISINETEENNLNREINIDNTSGKASNLKLSDAAIQLDLLVAVRGERESIENHIRIGLNNLGMYHIQSKQKSRLFKTLICSECDTAGLYQVA